MTKTMSATRHIPYKPLPIQTPSVRDRFRSDGSRILESDYQLPSPHRSIFHLLSLRANESRDSDFLAQREHLSSGKLGDWRRISYGEALEKARAIAQYMINRGIGPGRPVMVISGPSIEHGLFMLGALAARAPYTPVSTGYSLHSMDFTRLRDVFDAIRPAMIFTDDGPLFEPALKALPIGDIEIVSEVPPVDIAATNFSRILETPVFEAVDNSINEIRPDTHARTIFTSGSTGTPRGVVHTHGMISSYVAQQQAMLSSKRGYGRSPILSWLPWSHVGGASNLTMAINSGTTFFIDEGGPVSGKFEETLRNLREIPVTDFPSPPALFPPLLAALEKDTGFRDFFFGNLQLVIYGAAALSQGVLDKLQALSVAATGLRTPVISKYATTETLGISQATKPVDRTGEIGVPNAGVTIKLAPVGDLMELRVKGRCVMPGYLNDPDATAQAFDEEGFFKTGDAAELVDPDNPDRGLRFKGRIAENFKLSNGTWVHVSNLRTELIEALGPVRDCVIAGPDRDDLRVLAWLNEAEAASIAGVREHTPLKDIVQSKKLLEEIQTALEQYNRKAGGVSRRIQRLRLLIDSPSSGEITEKGSINQRLFLHKHTELIDELYASDTPVVTTRTEN